MIEFDFVGLRTFLAVCEKRSMTEAARHLGTTQSAVSQRLKKLEQKSKFRLIDRQLRPIGPTPAGQALLQRARRILSEIDKLEFELSRRTELPIPELRLGIADSLGSALAPALVSTIRKSVSQLAIRVDASIDLCRLFLDRDLHAIFSSDPLQDRDDLERHEIYREPMILALPIEELVEGEADLPRLERLVRTLPFIRYSPVSPLARQIEVHLRRLGVVPARDLEFNESETILEMVRHGLGWTITTPLCLLQSRVSFDDVAVCRLSSSGISRSFSFICRRNELGSLSRHLFQTSSAVIQERVVRRIAEELPWLLGSVSVVPVASESALAAMEA
jgi:DNA-binding transcriptional LysR family regulator